MSVSAFAQTDQNMKELSVQPATRFYVDGTSTLHKWSCTVKGVTGNFEADSGILTEPKTGMKFTMGNLVIPVENMDSGEGKGMNRKIYGALNSKKYPNITFALTSASVATVSDTAFTLQTTGNLTISGTTKTIDLVVSGKKQTDGSVLFTGQRQMKMSDFGIKPPSAMLGAIRSGDEITIRFNLVLN